MGRSRAAIQRDIDAVSESLDRLNAELEGVRSDTLTIESACLGAAIEFSMIPGGNSCRLGILARQPLSNAYYNEQAIELRDWLNYHFPKEDS